MIDFRVGAKIEKIEFQSRVGSSEFRAIQFGHSGRNGVGRQGAACSLWPTNSWNVSEEPGNAHCE